jgi:lipopolysaccharide/colanic/teichoic acid biosynthesis glycosyltransferase
MNIKSKTLVVFLLDILCLITVIIITGYLRKGSVSFNLYYIILIITWAFLSFIFGKYRFQYNRLSHEIIAILLNSVAILGLLSLFVISFQIYEKNYDFLFSQILIVTAIELFARTLYYLFNKRNYSKNINYKHYKGNIHNNKWGMMFLNLLWIFISFMFLVWLKPATLRIYIPNFYPFLIGILIWEFIFNLITGKHILKGKERYRDVLIPILRGNLITILTLAITIYLFNLFEYSRLIVFGTVIISAAIECSFSVYVIINSKWMKNLDESEIILALTPADQKYPRKSDHILFTFPNLEELSISAEKYLKEKVYKKNQQLFKYLRDHINLKGIEKEFCSVYDTRTLFNIESLTEDSKKLLINLHKVNDINSINEYFSILNKKIQYGGYIVGCGITIKDTYSKYKKRYASPLGHILYFFHFIFRRVLPKLPITREINYFLTKGSNRTLSKTEILGRLVFSGFKIIHCKEIGDKSWFIARKVNVPYKGDNPSYGPFISLNRIGKDGKIIKVYKFRTMHPYAEYIQDYVYEIGGGTIDGDGFRNDFRITGWGKIFRKLWIDELPMLINWIRGDLKLVGVRPLSLHKFNILDKDLQEKRVKYLPGLVPPFYADLPKSLKGIQDSERKYLSLYEKHKFLTDFRYFFKAFSNIIFKGARSK